MGTWVSLMKSTGHGEPIYEYEKMLHFCKRSLTVRGIDDNMKCRIWTHTTKCEKAWCKWKAVVVSGAQGLPQAVGPPEGGCGTTVSSERAARAQIRGSFMAGPTSHPDPPSLAEMPAVRLSQRFRGSPWEQGHHDLDGCRG